jgi:hypothetical protein
VDPKKKHGEAIKWLGRYLTGTQDKGLILHPDRTSRVEVYVDVDIVGTWDLDDIQSWDSTRSRYGYIIKYINCPILWKSQMATEIAMLNTTQGIPFMELLKVGGIPFMELLKVMQRMKVPIQDCKAKLHCKLYEENMKYSGTRSKG